MKKNYIIAAVAVIVVALGSYAYWNMRFCYDFVYDTQFGDKKDFSKAVNEGFMGLRGMMYYIPQVPALQKALEKDGFAIDEFERTGGKVYAAPFFGPSTKAAVIAFQEKYDLAPTGAVDNNMIDVLRSRYGCTAPKSPTEAAR